MPRSANFHSVWSVGAPEPGYLRATLLATAIGIVAGVPTTSTLLEKSPKASRPHSVTPMHFANQVINHGQSTNPGLVAKAPSPPSAVVPIQNTSSQAPSEGQHGDLTAGQSGLQTTFNAQSNPEQHCNIAACEEQYQSFRPSDCTYQPYSGPRRYCSK
jgi:BA14K-like protein